MKLELRKGCHEFSISMVLPATVPGKEGGEYMYNTVHIPNGTATWGSLWAKPPSKWARWTQEGKVRAVQGAETLCWKVTLQVNDRAKTWALTATMMGTLLPEPLAEAALGLVGLSLCHPRWGSVSGQGVNCWECQMRRANDELKEMSVLLLNNLVT